MTHPASPSSLPLLAWPDVRLAITAGRRSALIAVGAIEQHGPHLPLATDTLIASETARRVAERMPGVLLGPTLPVGVSTHHASFPGTLSLPERVFQDQVSACVASLGAHGIERVFVLSGHGGNFGPLARLETESGGRIGGATFVPFADLDAFVGVFHSVSAQDGISAPDSGAHAGEWETSIMLALHPELVRMERAEVGFLGAFDPEIADRLFAEGTASLAANGVLGDPTSATAERGERHLTAWVDTLTNYFTERS
ncbi:creatininase family protein [Microbacterium sp. RD1]|uniref:creatininase family protein n=1 Tax=Microbacterium sp. RD1 TaxID=3457313 RepID=UPI003FA57E30